MEYLTIYITEHNDNNIIINDNRIIIKYTNDDDFTDTCSTKYYCIINNYIEFYENVFDVIFNNLRSSKNIFLLENYYNNIEQTICVYNNENIDNEINLTDLYVGSYGKHLDVSNEFYKYKRLINDMFDKYNLEYSMCLIKEIINDRRLYNIVYYHVKMLNNNTMKENHKYFSDPRYYKYYQHEENCFYNLFDYDIFSNLYKIFGLVGIISELYKLEIDHNIIINYFNNICNNKRIAILTTCETDIFNYFIDDNRFKISHYVIKNIELFNIKKLNNTDIVIFYDPKNIFDNLDLNKLKFNTKYIITFFDEIKSNKIIKITDYIIDDNDIPIVINKMNDINKVVNFKNKLFNLNTNKQNILISKNESTNVSVLDFDTNIGIYIINKYSDIYNFFVYSDVKNIEYNNYYKFNKLDKYIYSVCKYFIVFNSEDININLLKNIYDSSINYNFNLIIRNNKLINSINCNYYYDNIDNLDIINTNYLFTNKINNYENNSNLLLIHNFSSDKDPNIYYVIKLVELLNDKYDIYIYHNLKKNVFIDLLKNPYKKLKKYIPKDWRENNLDHIDNDYSYLINYFYNIKDYHQNKIKYDIALLLSNHNDDNTNLNNNFILYEYMNCGYKIISEDDTKYDIINKFNYGFCISNNSTTKEYEYAIDNIINDYNPSYKKYINYINNYNFIFDILYKYDKYNRNNLEFIYNEYINDIHNLKLININDQIINKYIHTFFNNKTYSFIQQMYKIKKNKIIKLIINHKNNDDNNDDSNDNNNDNKIINKQLDINIHNLINLYYDEQNYINSNINEIISQIKVNYKKQPQHIVNNSISNTILNDNISIDETDNILNYDVTDDDATDDDVTDDDVTDDDVTDDDVTDDDATDDDVTDDDHIELKKKNEELEILKAELVLKNNMINELNNNMMCNYMKKINNIRMVMYKIKILNNIEIVLKLVYYLYREYINYEY